MKILVHYNVEGPADLARAARLGPYAAGVEICRGQTRVASRKSASGSHILGNPEAEFYVENSTLPARGRARSGTYRKAGAGSLVLKFGKAAIANPDFGFTSGGLKVVTTLRVTCKAG